MPGSVAIPCMAMSMSKQSTCMLDLAFVRTPQTPTFSFCRLKQLSANDCCAAMLRLACSRILCLLCKVECQGGP